jgi:hypothetical protein
MRRHPWDFGVDRGYWLLLGFSWFAPVSFAVGLVSGAVARMLRPR